MFYLFLKSIIFLAPRPRVPAFCCLLPFITKPPDSAVKSGTSLCHRCSLAVIHHSTRTVFTEVTGDHGLPGSVNSFSALSPLDLCSLQTMLSSILTLPAPSLPPRVFWFSLCPSGRFLSYLSGPLAGIRASSLSFHIQDITTSPGLPLNISHARPLVSTVTCLHFMGC